jgi:hypothetical protein
VSKRRLGLDDGPVHLIEPVWNTCNFVCVEIGDGVMEFGELGNGLDLLID